ncbi:SMC-Scp complex subunit ScpB [bacterium]|nr:SMC-Scp complex subunit ScpB [bacterium]MBU1936555.1 SMC-Scp complex subunit ScpB [bacterium]
MDITEENLKQIAEALIFASTEPLTEAQFIATVGDIGREMLPSLVVELNADYEREGRAFEILSISGGFQFFTRKDYNFFIQKLLAERSKTRLSRAALETLAIVAYRSPVTRIDIDDIRGVDSGGVLRTLLDRRLITVRGRQKGLGRPFLYETTPEFMQHFGLADLTELPRDGELAREWGPAEKKEET